MKENQHIIQASLLDRLIDNEPGTSHEPVQYRLTTFRQVKGAVGRDLENLLNTKNYVSSHCSEYQQLNNSVLTYGMPDFTSANPKSPAVRHKLRQELEKAIAQFEPRLRNVTVRVEDSGTDERNLRFKINALLFLDPAAEPVTFDTFFDVNRCEYSIPK
jgi:type VI secretion system protein ImpF